ncbi:hypothetical protein [Modestobacter marinus]|uniref:hypothetical protein n=1 Tax=Modestobacter marinus TaxID=477641 RepID=UPI001C93E549|nr:hypothetical protein [Modestobacter marinus]
MEPTDPLRTGEPAMGTPGTGRPDPTRLGPFRTARSGARVRAAVAETGVRGRTRVQVLTGPVAEVLTALSEPADVLVPGRDHGEAGRAG